MVCWACARYVDQRSQQALPRQTESAQCLPARRSVKHHVVSCQSQLRVPGCSIYPILPDVAARSIFKHESKKLPHYHLGPSIEDLKVILKHCLLDSHRQLKPRERMPCRANGTRRDPWKLIPAPTEATATYDTHGTACSAKCGPGRLLICLSLTILSLVSLW